MGTKYPAPVLDTYLSAVPLDKITINFTHNLLVPLTITNFEVAFINPITNQEICTCTGEVEEDNLSIIKINKNNIQDIEPYNFYKVKIAYKDGNINGFWSNIGVIKILDNYNDCTLNNLINHDEFIYSYQIGLWKDQCYYPITELHYNYNDENFNDIFQKIFIGYIGIGQPNHALVIKYLTINGFEQYEQISNSNLHFCHINQIDNNIYNNNDVFIKLDQKYEYKVDKELITNYYLLFRIGIQKIDYCVEYGKIQKYLYQSNIINEYNLSQYRNYFENINIFDNSNFLSIQFNPKINNYKTTILEQKIDTIGGQFPIFYKNGDTKYKEFSISGLLSYELDKIDNMYSFFNQEEIDDILNNQSEIILSHYIDKQFFYEKIFRDRVYKWLTNGEPKVFCSPTEGTMIIRLFNISLTPEEKLGRMIYSFSATAYEIMEYNYFNVLKYNLNYTPKHNDINIPKRTKTNHTGE